MQTQKLLALTAAIVAGAVTSIAVISSQKTVHAVEFTESASQSEESSFFPTCVFGWSKNNCQGSLTGNAFSDVCVLGTGPVEQLCRTHYVRGELTFPVRVNSEACDPTSTRRCDQTPELVGRLTIYGEFVFSGQGCHLRGAWKGDWRMADVNGQHLAFGTGQGTLGTSSQRTPTCLSSDQSGVRCPRDCNSCYNVTTSPGSSHTQPVNWHVGLEGVLEGTVNAGSLNGSEIMVTVTGVLSTPGTNSGPSNLGSWRYCGASDGVVLARCQSIISTE